MGFLIDIAEIAGLLFVAYTAGWLAGYFAHRLTARAAPGLATATAQPLPVAQEPDADALVKAPVVVPVATIPPPQVLAAATAIEPVKATAVPDAGEPLPRPDPLPAEPTPPPVSALDTLKSLSTAMPLMPSAEPPPDPVQAGSDTGAEVVPNDVSIPTVGEAEAPPVPKETAEPEAPSAPIAVEPAPRAAAAPIAVEPVAPATVETPRVAPTEIAVPSVSRSAPPAAPAQESPAPVKRRIRIAPATKAGETAARPVDPPPMPASAPGIPWAGAINGHEAQKFAPEGNADAAKIAPAVSEDSIPEPDAALDVALLSSLADQLEVDRSTPADRVMVTEPSAPPAEPPPDQVAAPPTELEMATEPAAPIESVPPPAQAAAAPAAPPGQPLDEDAAMRAIEGGWSRRDVRALSDAPELPDVSAAVSAAQMAVEQVLARNGVDAAEPDSRTQASFGKPPGLPEPRGGRRDNLKRIDGLGPLDEVTLNNLGIYHFEQIARWNEREVLWLENHAFAVGRIGREAWQDQARDLLAERDATRSLR